ncbi:MAG: NifU family protein [Planctomycetota bacterium]
MPEELQVNIEESAAESDTCVIRVNRVVSPTPMYYGTAEEAVGAPLARRLLESGHLEGVLVQNDTVTLLKPVPGEEWPVVTAAAEEILRAHFQEMDGVASEATREMNPEEKQLFESVRELLDAEINPMVASHGGVIEILDVKGKTVFIHMGGGCQGCGMAHVTLKQGVEAAIRQRMPEIEEILDTTDHASGKNPYYGATAGM